MRVHFYQREKNDHSLSLLVQSFPFPMDLSSRSALVVTRESFPREACYTFSCVQFYAQKPIGTDSRVPSFSVDDLGKSLLAGLRANNSQLEPFFWGSLLKLFSVSAWKGHRQNFVVFHLPSAVYHFLDT